jgi:hypothetical protein
MIHKTSNAESAAILRITVFSMWFYHLWHDPIQELASMPLVLFSPIGVLDLLPSDAWPLILSGPFLWTMKILLLIALLLLILGVRPFWRIAIPACIALTLYQGLTRSFGKINHGELAMLYSAYVLAISPCVDALSVMKPRKPSTNSRYAAALFAMATVLCLTYTFVGVRRFAVGGSEIFLDESILSYVAHRSAEPGPFNINFGLMVLEHPLMSKLLEVSFFVLTAFEALSMLALFNRWFRWSWVVMMLGFHVSTIITMQISFSANMVLIVLLLTPATPYASTWIHTLFARRTQAGRDLR